MILCFGSNFFGQLGLGIDGSRENSPAVPCQFAPTDDGQVRAQLEKVIDIQCGAQFSVALMKAGCLYICGTLNGVVYPSISPVEILYPLRCTQIAAGRKHILACMYHS